MFLRNVDNPLPYFLVVLSPYFVEQKTQDTVFETCIANIGDRIQGIIFLNSVTILLSLNAPLK
jgi:hypothetical protein